MSAERGCRSYERRVAGRPGEVVVVAGLGALLQPQVRQGRRRHLRLLQLRLRKAVRGVVLRRGGVGVTDGRANLGDVVAVAWERKITSLRGGFINNNGATFDFDQIRSGYSEKRRRKLLFASFK